MKVMPLDKDAAVTTQLCNEISYSDCTKEVISKLLEKNESIYKCKNNITSKQNNESNCYENINSCNMHASELRKKNYKEIADFSKSSICIMEQTLKEDLIGKKTPDKTENEEINNPDELTVHSTDYFFDNELHTEDSTKNISGKDDPTCLWKEIINELGYDIEKTLSDIQESCKKIDKKCPSEEKLEDISNNTHSMEVVGDVRELKASTSNNASLLSVRLLDERNYPASPEVNQNLSFANEELVTDLDDIITDQRPVTTRENKDGKNTLI